MKNLVWLMLTFLALRVSAGEAGKLDTPPARTQEQANQAKVVLAQRGYVVPVERAEVWPRVSGHVIEIAANAEVGKAVKRGDVLARLDPVPFELAHRRATAALKRAEARLLQLKNGPRPEEVQQAKLALVQTEEQRKQLQAELERLQKLREAQVVPMEAIEKAQGRARAAELEVEKMRAAHDVVAKGARKEQLDAAEADVEMARADLDLAAYRLAGTRVVSPLSGTILSRRASLGDAVQSQPDHRSEGLFTVSDLSKLEVELDIQERDVQIVFAGQGCAIQPDAFPKVQYQGKVSRLMPMANRAKGALGVRVLIDIPKNDDHLRPDMSVVVSFFAKE
jgi:multidrug resistance efflux pump